jgi:SAM-dependent methyltransferase
MCAIGQLGGAILEKGANLTEVYMVERQEIEQLLKNILEKGELILAILSSPHVAKDILKLVIRPLLIKGKTIYQVTENRQQQAFHHNLSKEECLNWLKQRLEDFKQIFFYTTAADYHVLLSKKSQFTLLKKAPSKAPRELSHNRQKKYLLQEGESIPFLVHLGIMNAEGKVYAAKKDKFRQINRFLEMIDDVLPHLDSSYPLRIIDFGCGKAYLTFALYHFLKITKGYLVQLIGIDLKREVIQYCQELAQALGYQDDLQFIREDIDHYQIQYNVDMVVSLHACDTATDAALEKAIRWQAQVILSVPCCQHELMHQIQQEELQPLLKHGILKERFAALATDAARVQLLEVLGYQAQILEFIDIEHTPKNLLIRAIKRSQSDGHRKAAWQAYLNFKRILHITPSLERRFQLELDL